MPSAMSACCDADPAARRKVIRLMAKLLNRLTATARRVSLEGVT